MNNRNCLGIVKILFPKKTVIISSPKSIAEWRALKHLRDQNPGVDVVDPSKGSVDLSSYENVVVQGHGGTTGNAVGLGGKGVNDRQLADFLNESGFQGSSVELAACNTGTSFGGKKPFAERLSEILGIPVTGYPHEIAIKPGGIVRRRGFGSQNNKYLDKVADLIDDTITDLSTLGGGTAPTPKTFPGK